MATGISWADEAWNPVVGCSPVSPGCARCYAATTARRLEAFGQPQYRGLANPDGTWSGEVRCLPEALLAPYRWTRPRVVFVGSMCDLFHDGVPDAFLDRIWDVMRGTDHVYLVLTKRAARLRRYLLESQEWRVERPDNIWGGVSIETAAQLGRLDHLASGPLPLAGRFLSLEPLLGPLAGPLGAELGRLGDTRHPTTWPASLAVSAHSPVDWIIAGGESGAGARPMRPEWVRGVRDLCVSRAIPFHFKQWGPRGQGAELDGRRWGARPPDKVRDALWIEPPSRLRGRCLTCPAPVHAHSRCRACLSAIRTVARDPALSSTREQHA